MEDVEDYCHPHQLLPADIIGHEMEVPSKKTGMFTIMKIGVFSGCRMPMVFPMLR
jgi:hypothetical protein